MVVTQLIPQSVLKEYVFSILEQYFPHEVESIKKKFTFTELTPPTWMVINNEYFYDVCVVDHWMNDVLLANLYGFSFLNMPLECGINQHIDEFIYRRGCHVMDDGSPKVIH